VPAPTVLASPCAGTDGWAILAEPPGVRDLGDPRYWETSLERSVRRRGTRPVSRFGARREVRVAAALALTALAAPGVAGASTTDLMLGSRGGAVRALQAKLGVAVDGIFGPQTQQAVRSFQRSHGVPATGLVGPLTRAALGGMPSSDTSGDDDQGTSGSTPSTRVTASAAQVRAIQRQLGVTIDGVIGPQTRAAIKSYQSAHGLSADGQPSTQLLSALGVSGTTTAPTGTSGQPTTTNTASDAGAAAVQAAMSKVGASYSYGATGPSSFDCSGLVMWAFSQAGVSLPHSSYAQYGMGQSVSSSQIQPGDLVFFNTAGSGPSDVGIATSASTAVSATTHGVMTHSIHSGYWGSHFVGARRVA
jgi:cell wall-associated NlpC family hydrolase